MGWLVHIGACTRIDRELRSLGSKPALSFNALLQLGTALASFSLIGALAQPHSPSGESANRKLNPGDIVYADSGDAIRGGFVIKVDVNSGEQTVLSSGRYLQLPFDPVVNAAGEVIVSDSGRLIKINPETGNQTILADNSQGTLGLPYGITLNSSGVLMAANLQAIIQIEPVTGRIDVVAKGGSLSSPLGVVEGASGELYVLNVGMKKQIIRVTRGTVSQRVVSEGGYFKNPQALAMLGQDIYVTDVADSDGNFGTGRVLLINAITGDQKIISEGGYLVGPVGIVLDGSGQLIVGDPYTVKRKSADLYDGGIIRINPATGQQTLVVRGHGSYVNPRGVAIVPALATAHK